MKAILDEASYSQEEIIDNVSVIDEKMYMEYDKQGESFNINDFSDPEVKWYWESLRCLNIDSKQIFTKAAHPFYGNCYTLSIPMTVSQLKI